MPSKDEIRVLQKRELTRLRFIMEGRISLEDAILATEAEMEVEDVAYVKEKTAETLVKKTNNKKG